MPKAETTAQSREGCSRDVRNVVDYTIRAPIQHNPVQKCFSRLRDVGPTLNPCVFCGRSHFHWLCPLDGRTRTSIIRATGRCVQCLERGHFRMDCQAECCRRCDGKHHTWLHYKGTNKDGPPNYKKFQRSSNQTPPGTDNKWTTVHQYFYVRTPGSAPAPAPDNPQPGTSSEETILLNRAMPESWRPNNMTQLWRRNDEDRQHPTKNPQPNARK